MFSTNKYDIWFEMGPYGSVGAHIKTGKRYMAQDHFKTPPDPKKGNGMTKKQQKKKDSLLELANLQFYFFGLMEIWSTTLWKT